MAHPLAMFEVMAVDQQRLIDFYTGVFGWQVVRGESGFAYIRFPRQEYDLLGGIGMAMPGVAGWGAGVTFYILSDDLGETLDAVRSHGGAVVVEPVTADGYHFAMFEDPETNLVGIIEPFGDVPPPPS